MSKAAVACGADGLLVEVHPNPDKALKDGVQSITIQTFEQLMPELAAVALAVGRILPVPSVV
jgi:3-deoxy-7-phosphoheptulonate synthase